MAFYPNLLGMGPGVPVVEYPRYGDVSPFASQYDPTGRLQIQTPAAAAGAPARGALTLAPPWRPPLRRRRGLLDDGGDGGGDDYGFGRGYSGPPVDTLGAFAPAVSFDEWAQRYSPEIYGAGIPQEHLAKEYAAAMAPDRRGLLDSWKSGGVGGVLSNFTGDDTMMFGTALGGLLGVPFVGQGLHAIGDYTQGRIDSDYAMEQLGAKGYNAFTYDGAPFSISPGIFGGRAITAGGLVPDWLTVDMVDEWQAEVAAAEAARGLDWDEGGGWVEEMEAKEAAEAVAAGRAEPVGRAVAGGLDWDEGGGEWEEDFADPGDEENYSEWS